MRNLKYIIAVCVIALSACSTSQKLASTSAPDDDVYFTQAKAGDQIVYADNNYRNNTGNYGYDDYDDDYYYYGDYSSRINRFGYNSPFPYYDNFYYGYSPYNRWGMGFGWNTGLGWNMGLGYGLGWGYNPFGYGGMYSPYFYDPFYASFYGYGWGMGYAYSPWGYGYGYSPWGYGGYGWGYGGGFLVGGSARQNPRPVYAGGTASSVGVPTRNIINQSMNSGRRPGDLSIQNINTRGSQPRAVRDVGSRDGYNNRPQVQQARPTYNPPAPTNFGGNSGGGSSSGGGGGGGGRPVRP